MYRKLLFKNLIIVWNIKIILISFSQESPQMLCAILVQIGEKAREEFEN